MHFNSKEERDAATEQTRMRAAGCLADCQEFILMTRVKNEDGSDAIQTICGISPENAPHFLEALQTASLTLVHQAIEDHLDARGARRENPLANNEFPPITEEDFGRFLAGLTEAEEEED